MVAVLPGCLSMKSYVDPALPMVHKSDIAGAPSPKPLQVAFEFRTKGALNASATSQMRPRLIAVASESGLFTTVSATAPEGADSGLLTVVIDNIAITDNAAAKGFGTGLTLGAVGSIVTDGYTCTATYVRNSITTQVSTKHALHTTIGNHAGPAGLTPVTPQQGVEQVIDQLSWNVIKQLADKKAFE
jgi:hypothetical protein